MSNVNQEWTTENFYEILDQGMAPWMNSSTKMGIANALSDRKRGNASPFVEALNYLRQMAEETKAFPLPLVATAKKKPCNSKLHRILTDVRVNDAEGRCLYGIYHTTSPNYTGVYQYTWSFSILGVSDSYEPRKILFCISETGQKIWEGLEKLPEGETDVSHLAPLFRQLAEEMFALKKPAVAV